MFSVFAISHVGEAHAVFANRMTMVESRLCSRGFSYYIANIAVS